MEQFELQAILNVWQLTLPLRNQHFGNEDYLMNEFEGVLRMRHELIFEQR